MTSKLIPVISNELLDRPVIESFNSELGVLSSITRCSTLLLCDACLTPELTGRDEPQQQQSLADEGNAIRAPVE